MKQINEKQLLFEKGELTGEKCIDSMCNMVSTYQHASPKEQYDIEQRLYHHCPELAGRMIDLCRQGVRKDFPNFRHELEQDIDREEPELRCRLAQLQYIADGTIE